MSLTLGANTKHSSLGTDYDVRLKGNFMGVHDIPLRQATMLSPAEVAGARNVSLQVVNRKQRTEGLRRMLRK